MATSRMTRLFGNTVRRIKPILKERGKTVQYQDCIQTSRKKIHCKRVAFISTGFVSLGLMGIEASKQDNASKSSETSDSNSVNDASQERDAKLLTQVDNVDRLTQLYREAKAICQDESNDLQIADRKCSEGLELADELYDGKQISHKQYITVRTLLIDRRANIALSENKLEAAELLFKETIQGCLEMGMAQDNNVIIEISLKLAGLFAKNNNREQAEEGFKFCVDKLIAKVTLLTKWEENSAGTSVNTEDIVSPHLSEEDHENALLLGKSLGSYGKFLMNQMRHNEAVDIFERSRLVIKHTIGVNSNQYCLLLNELATVYILLQRDEQAKAVLSDGISISKKFELPGVANLHCNLGYVYLRRGDLVRAKTNCQLGEMFAKKYDQAPVLNSARKCLENIDKLEKTKASNTQ